MTFSIRDVAKYALVSLPGAPLPLLERLAVEGLRDFCKRSRIWKYWFGPIDVENNVADYDLDPIPNGAVICDIVRCRINYAPDDPRSEDEIYPYSEQGTDRPLPFTYNRALVNQISLRPTPCQDLPNFLRVEAVLMPAPLVTECTQDVIWNEHLETIRHFIEWNAYAMPGETWSDDGKAVYHKGMYDNFAEQARNQVRSGNMNPRHRTRPSDFG